MFFYGTYDDAEHLWTCANARGAMLVTQGARLHDDFPKIIFSTQSRWLEAAWRKKIHPNNQRHLMQGYVVRAVCAFDGHELNNTALDLLEGDLVQVRDVTFEVSKFGRIVSNSSRICKSVNLNSCPYFHPHHSVRVEECIACIRSSMAQSLRRQALDIPAWDSFAKRW